MTGAHFNIAIHHVDSIHTVDFVLQDFLTDHVSHVGMKKWIEILVSFNFAFVCNNNNDKI